MSKCKNCGAELHPDAKFCMECGTKVPVIPNCSNCGAELQPGAKFCMECGTPVQQQGVGIQMGDANAISAQNVVGGNLEIVNGTKEIVHGDKISAGNYTINNVTNETGYAQGSVNVEELLQTGKDYYDAENYFKALSIFREIADKDIEAIYYIARCTRDGDGTQQDYAKAAELFEQAATAGFPPAQRSLAHMLMNSDYGMLDIDKAIEWFTKAADGKDWNALVNLGEIYLCGYHVEKDEEKALSLLQRAHRINNACGELNAALGNIYFAGNVINRDIDKAYQFYHANEGKHISFDYDYDVEINSEYLLNCAKILINNLGGHGDTKFGIQYLELASEKFNSEEAREILSCVCNNTGITYFKRLGKTLAMDANGFVFNDDLTEFLYVDYDNMNQDLEELIIPNTVRTLDGCF